MPAIRRRVVTKRVKAPTNKSGIWPRDYHKVFKTPEDAYGYFFDKIFSEVKMLDEKGKIFTSAKAFTSKRGSHKLFSAGAEMVFTLTPAQLTLNEARDVAVFLRTIFDPKSGKLEQYMRRAFRIIVIEGYLRPSWGLPLRRLDLPKEATKAKGLDKYNYPKTERGFRLGATRIADYLYGPNAIVKYPDGSIGLRTIEEFLAQRVKSKSPFSSIFMMQEFGTGSLAKPEIRPYTGTGATFYKVNPALNKYMGRSDKQKMGKPFKQIPAGAYFTSPRIAKMAHEVVAKQGYFTPKNAGKTQLIVSDNFEHSYKRKVPKKQWSTFPFYLYASMHHGEHGTKEMSGRHAIFLARNSRMIVSGLRNALKLAAEAVIGMINLELAERFPNLKGSLPQITGALAATRQLGALGAIRF